ncbi:MAG: hypothetical protein R3C58_03930 [Parvularculaceae bacterium]
MTQQNQLKRVLTKLDAAVLGFGAMIGWGWIILAGGWIVVPASSARGSPS